MNCNFCEASLVPGGRYCPHCGTAVANPQPPGAHPADKPYGYAAPSQGAWAGGYAPRYAAGPQSTSHLAIASLVCGLLSWFMLPILGAIPAVFIGQMARREIRESGGRLEGESMAFVGMLMGGIQLAIVALVVGVIILIVGARVVSRM